MILTSFLFGVLLIPLSEDASPPVVLNMMFMLWHGLINSEDISSASYSFCQINATFLSLYINVVTGNFRMSRGRHLIVNGNQKGYKVAEHIYMKVKVNPRMLSTFKNEKFI